MPTESTMGTQMTEALIHEAVRKGGNLSTVDSANTFKWDCGHEQTLVQAAWEGVW